MRRVVFNQKGGVGKTSVSCNLAASFAEQGKKTLVIDLDTQGNATQYLLGSKVTGITKTIADYFESTLSFKLFKDSLEESIYQTPYSKLYIIPSDPELGTLQPKLESRYKIFKLAESLKLVEKEMGFEEIIIDTPPALNFYSMSALIASQSVLIPYDCDAFSADGVLKVFDLITEVAADHQPSLKAEGIIVTQYQSQAKVPAEAIAKLKDRNFTVLEPYLSDSVIMKESHEKKIPLIHLKPNHKLTAEFVALSKTLSHESKTRS